MESGGGFDGSATVQLVPTGGTWAKEEPPPAPREPPPAIVAAAAESFPPPAAALAQPAAKKAAPVQWARAGASSGSPGTPERR